MIYLYKKKLKSTWHYYVFKYLQIIFLFTNREFVGLFFQKLGVSPVLGGII